MPLGIEQLGDESDGRGSATELLDFDGKVAGEERFREGVVVGLVNSIGLLSGLRILEKLVVLVEAFKPKRRWQCF